jgi:hypothetical protein
VNVIETRKIRQNQAQALRDRLLRKLDFSHANQGNTAVRYPVNLPVKHTTTDDVFDSLERTNARNFVAGMNHSGRLALRAHEHDINEFRRGRHRLHLFKVVDGHDCSLSVVHTHAMCAISTKVVKQVCIGRN